MDRSHVLQPMILPNELIVCILDISDYRTLLTCMQVCSNFKHLIEKTTSLQYTIELATSGQLDGSSDSVSSSKDRLNILQKHQSAWKQLKWTRELTIPMVVSNNFLGPSQTVLSGGVLGQRNRDDQFIFHQLPSELRGIKENTWSLRSNWGFSIEIFAMDPYQDLLVLVELEDPAAILASTFECHIYLRSLAAGNPHSFANVAILKFPQHKRIDVRRLVHSDCQIFGNIVSLLITTVDEDQAVIWDWKTGKVLLNTYSMDLDTHHIISYQYVTFAIVEKDSNICLSVVNFKEASSDCQELSKIRDKKTFRYPLLTDDGDPESVQIHFGPGPLYQKAEQVPFFQGSDYSLLVIIITIRPEPGKPKVLFHFIPSQYLISLVESDSRDTVDSTWISKGTRMFFGPPYNAVGGWTHSTFGTRFVTGELLASDGQREIVVRLYDFNKLALRRDSQRSIKYESVSGWADFSSSCLPRWCSPFAEEFDTSLPYWKNVAYVRLKEDENDNNTDEVQCAVRCCEDNIVITDFVNKEYRILVF